MSETQDHVRRLLSMLANLLESCLQRWWYLLKSPYGYVVVHYINMYDHVVIAALLYTTVLVSFPRILFPETMKLWIRGFFHAWKKKTVQNMSSSVGKHGGMWARKLLWSNCKWTCSQTNQDFSCGRNTCMNCCLACCTAKTTGGIGETKQVFRKSS